MNMTFIFTGTLLSCACAIWAGQVFRQPTEQELKQAAVQELKSPATLHVQKGNRISVEVCLRDGSVIRGNFSVPPVSSQKILRESHSNVPLFDARKWGWNKGSALSRIRGSIRSLKQGSLVVKSGTGADAQIYTENRDYKLDEHWGCFGRIPGGRIPADAVVSVDYEKTMRRIDSIFLRDRTLLYRQGREAASVPQPPAAQKGEIRIANIAWIGGEKELTAENLFPITECCFPIRNGPVAEELLPRTLKKLRSGEPLHVLAWGDSVTEGYWGLKQNGKWVDRWQEQFVRALRTRFPKARIRLTTEGWGGHNTDHYLATKPGDIHSYQDKVLNRKADLLIFEFLNDSGMRDPSFTRQYERILKDLREANPEIEIIAILPHHTSEGRNIDGNDSRPYIRLLREFCVKHHLAYADVSHRYSRLHRQGIPPMLLMVNNHNHPLKEGMKVFADTLLDLFPAQ